MLILAVPFYSAPGDELYLGMSKGRENFSCAWAYQSIWQLCEGSHHIPERVWDRPERRRTDQRNPNPTPQGALGAAVPLAALPRSSSGHGEPSKFGTEQPKTAVSSCSVPILSSTRRSEGSSLPWIRSRHSVPNFICVFPKIMNTGRSPNSRYCTLASPHKTVIS